MVEGNSKTYFSEKLPADLPIFYQPFYLDAIAGSQWEVVYVSDDEGIISCMPFYFQKKNFRIIRQPHFAIYQGPFIPEKIRIKMSLSQEMEMLALLEKSLPAYDFYNQNWHPTLRNWLPFYWRGFLQSSRYSYIIENENIDLVRKRYSLNVIRNIKKASKIVSIEESDDEQIVLQLVSKTFERKGAEDAFDPDVLKKVIVACRDNHCCKILVAKDASQNHHAAMLLVWDAQVVYYLIGGLDPTFRSSGSMSLLFDHAITFTMQAGKTFDFEGSMIPSIENFFRSFGSKQQQYFVVTKVNSSWLRVRLAMAKFFSFLKPF